jgi:ferredoxin-NADP reductase
MYNNIMKLKLVKKVEEAIGTKSFYWETEKEVRYDPGQYFYFTLPKLEFPDPRGATRHFTLSSSPTEIGYIQNTTRIRQESGYKKTIDSLPVGSTIEGEGPNGTFLLDDKELGPHIFIAGGIGITPFRSIIKYLSDKKLKTQINLIYSDSTPQDMPFKKELEEMAKVNPNIKIQFVFTKTDGRIDETKIKTYLQTWGLDSSKVTWWLCGPPAMIDAMESLLGSFQIPFGHVRVEKFTGY